MLTYDFAPLKFSFFKFSFSCFPYFNKRKDAEVSVLIYVTRMNFLLL